MSARLTIIGMMTAGAAALLWATLPPDEVALGQTCHPLGGTARLSSFLYPGPFWRAQHAALVAERDMLLAQPARRARLAAEAEREARDAPGIESRMTRLSREEQQTDDRDAQERRAAAEQTERLKRLTWLIGCEEEIARRRAE
jgi:hypothetical protein